MAAGVLVVLVTCPTRRHATRVARAVIAKRVAACVNILPGLESVFWWAGKVDSARETLLLIKTTASCFGLLRDTVLSLHPYELPEIVALPIKKAHSPYLQWIYDSVTPASKSQKRSLP